MILVGLRMPQPRSFVVGTAGHIDHGKTALVRALTGVDTDRLPQEKERGITIDLGFAALDLGTAQLAFVDVPGHERFIRNMLAGATAIDLALLVIAADDSVMPQTREHLDILRLLNLKSGVIALSKCDLVDAAWLELVESELREFVSGTFLDDAPIVRTSAARGEGIDALRETLARRCGEFPAHDDPGLFRMSIDRVFAIEGHGTVVTGTVTSGRVSVGDTLECWPGGARARVRGLHRHDRKVDSIERGARAAINLAGVHHLELKRGCEVAASGYLTPSHLLTVTLRACEAARFPLCHRRRYKVHLGTGERTARLITSQADDPRLGQLVFAEPIFAVYGQPFVLREESPPATIGGGVVLEPTARRMRRRTWQSADPGSDASVADEAARLESALTRAKLQPWSTPALVRETGMPEPRLQAARDRLRAEGRLIELPVAPRRTALLSAAFVESLESRVLETLARRHESRPRASVIRRSDVTSAFMDLDSETLVAAVIDRLRDAKKIAGDQARLALASFVPKLSQAESRQKTALLDAIRGGGHSPPLRDELLAGAKQQPAVVADLLALLVDEGQIVEIADGFWLSADNEESLRNVLVEAFQRAGADGMTMAQLRDALKTTRKYAVPIGEYLDRIGLTIREGEVRRLASTPQALATRSA